MEKPTYSGRELRLACLSVTTSKPLVSEGNLHLPDTNTVGDAFLHIQEIRQKLFKFMWTNT